MRTMLRNFNQPCARGLSMRLLLALCVMTFLAVAQDPKVIQWETDFDVALTKARDTGKPIMIVFLMKGESANEDVARNHLHDATVVAASRKFVCLIGCIGLHTEHSDSPCTTFDGTTCKQHEAVEVRARTTYMGSPVVEAPQFLFLAPDGKRVLLRHVWLLAAQELKKKMELAYAFHDPKNAAPEFRERSDRVLELLKQADGNNADERRMALAALASEDDPRIVEFLIRQTKPEVSSVKRLEAIDAMGTRGNAKVLPCLIDLLKQKDTQIRLHVAAVLENIGMRECAKALLDTLVKENQDLVRGRLLRALASCEKDAEVIRKEMLKLMKGTGQPEVVAACLVAETQPRHPDVDKALQKVAASSNSSNRIGGYHAIGMLKILEAKGQIERQLSSDRDPAKSVGLWALAQLGGAPYGGEVDVAEVVADLQRDGALGDGEGGGKGGKGGGGRGGGGRGGGGRGR